MTSKFSNAAKRYGLQISITKAEVMYQPAPIDDLQLPITKRFKYLGSVLSNDAQMDEDIKAIGSAWRAAPTVAYKKGSGNPMA